MPFSNPNAIITQASHQDHQPQLRSTGAFSRPFFFRSVKHTLALLLSLLLTLSMQAQGPSPDLNPGDPNDTLTTDTTGRDTNNTATTDTSSENLSNVLLDADSADKAIEEELSGKVRLNLSTPYHTVLSHLAFLQRDENNKFVAPDSAARTLYVKDPESPEAQELAIKLIEYYDGQGYYIDLDAISKDPNYIDTTTLKGKHVFFPVPEVQDIYLVKRGQNWLYSRATVQAIPNLHKETFPLGTFRWVPTWSRTKLLGIEIYKYLLILAFILASIILYRLINFVIRLILRNVISRYIRQGEARKFFRKVARPASYLLLALILTRFIPNLQLPVELNKYVMLILRMAVPLFGIMIFYNLVDLISAFLSKQADKTDTTLDDQLIPLVRKVMKGVVIVLGIAVMLGFIGVDIGALIATISIGGIAIAFAAQDTIANFFGSFMIFVDRPFQVGDWVIAGDVEGTVEEVGFRSTLIRTFANSLIYIPNGIIANGAINNMGKRSFRRYVVNLGLTYDTPPDLIEAYVEGLREIIKNHPHTRKDAFEIHFTALNDFNLNIMVYIFFDVPSWTKELECKQDVNLAFMRLAETLGVNFAFPTQTLHIENMAGQPSSSPDYQGNSTTWQERNAGFINEWKTKWEARHQASKDPGAFGGDGE